MIHPDTEVRFVNPEIGYGVFATADIPRGTIVYVKDRLEIELHDEAFRALDEQHRAIADKYSYIDENGIRILSWDHAKYVNHRCDCNTISTGYGFEIAIRNIWKGEEVCDDYGLFNIEEEIPLACHCPNCRGSLKPDDLDHHYQLWDSLIIPALEKVTDVHQPLMDFMDSEVKQRLRSYLCGEEQYTSVLCLKHQKHCLSETRGNSAQTPWRGQRVGR